MLENFDEELQFSAIENIAYAYTPLQDPDIRNEISTFLEGLNEGEELNSEEVVGALIKSRTLDIMFCSHENPHIKRILIISAVTIVEMSNLNKINLDRYAKEELLGQVLGVIATVNVDPGNPSEDPAVPWALSIKLLESFNIGDHDQQRTLGIQVDREPNSRTGAVVKKTGSFFATVMRTLGVTFVKGVTNATKTLEARTTTPRNCITMMLQWQAPATFHQDIERLGELVGEDQDRTSFSRIVEALQAHLMNLALGDLDVHGDLTAGTSIMAELVTYYVAVE